MKANPKTRGQAKALRKKLTEAEWTLWHKLKAKQFFGLHFRKQHPIGPYITDFACVKIKVIIEVDGDSHYFEVGVKKDEIRTEYLNNLGWTVYRYSNDEIYHEVDSVLDDLYIKLEPHLAASTAKAGEVSA
ncbi:endonuclease domain-containing protein [Robiginitomaculum antarcticum]|uniref:endonuclease domain-containing protein n=2 Tax=Robiginitomaculum antarcticum TaxID=437507 RepID=UPI00035E5D7E|nr:DUF559 domain-containing protein [Robiginitomaculum antarcticum]